jgi:response regulator RpfG family c-di-GMP phosphodiesterase
MADKKHTDICLYGEKEAASFLINSGREFGYATEYIANIDDLLESPLEPSLLFVIEDVSSEIALDEIIQAGRQQFPHAYLIILVEKELTKEKQAFFEKQGVRMTLLVSEAKTGKLPFLINQILRANYIPLKSMDLVANSELGFDIYHLLPQRKKFLKILRRGDSISSDRLARLLENPEFYVDRADLMAYKKFVEATSDLSAKGLAKRCRANFVALQSEFASLALQVTDEASRLSFHEGQELLIRCQKLCEDLLANLSEFPRAWDIVNSSAIGEFGSLERAPAVAAFSGIFALRGDMKRVDEIMMASLIVDMGLLTISNSISQAIRDGRIQSISVDEKSVYHRVPLKSLDLALGRKLAIPEKLRNIVIAVYENADGTGFPNKYNDFKIPIEAQMIRFAKEFDSRIQVRLGRARRDPLEVIQDIISDQSMRGVFSQDFFRLLSEKILPSTLTELGTT